ncbi:LysR family transcriptional regulator [Paracidovorax citrulli]|uniref:Transcriptional regulator, LysR family n=4 Tax=Pseudomonadota TaxID=1224 RepID=A1TSL3_PARC0|nr:LysR family transcriptional regulator [Paracidovorax citrulli]ABM33951.1 transcriptional regulator, LysR family [Paracidovorax citrulli AAC00-1]ATG94512.1 LysR family transcriptional regulator [Paracidovorax citrulli]MVT38701.1 LysR family transcriptional regulator [Paracidovorax citrulli]PVY63387.1 DNA-binding transcriptional LysR family regulator [Paracidovorax citrulli]QCX12331.1 HTH-type transcriptional regulator CynR [Paracidovorax citrulli]
MHLSSRHIDAFLALAQERSFTRAAGLCHLSQPAFSALVRSLEDGLGLRLFDRSTRHVELTPEGLQFLDSARRLRVEIDSAIGRARDAAQLRRGRVSLALLPSLAAGWLPGLLAGFRADHPQIELDIADVLSEPCIERVASGRADFALAAIRADTPSLQAEPFCSDSFHLVCRADHPLAKRRPRGGLQVQDLAPWPFVHLARTSSVRQYLEAAIHPHAMNTLMEVEQLATVMGMVRAGIGISVVPTLTLFHFSQPGLVTRPLSLPSLTRQIFLVRRRDRDLSIAARELYRRVMENRPRA